jgi:hypothetical protein
VKHWLRPSNGGRKTADRKRQPRANGALLRSRRNMVGRMHDFARHTHEFVETSAGNDDCVSSSVRFLSNTHETPALVFSEFDIEMLTLNLKFSRDNYIIHFAWRDTIKPFAKDKSPAEKAI